MSTTEAPQTESVECRIFGHNYIKKGFGIWYICTVCGMMCKHDALFPNRFKKPTQFKK
jgi:hypothetical protein